MTNECNVALTVFTADCVPVYLYDPKARAIGDNSSTYAKPKRMTTVQLQSRDYSTKA